MVTGNSHVEYVAEYHKKTKQGSIQSHEITVTKCRSGQVFESSLCTVLYTSLIQNFRRSKAWAFSHECMLSIKA